MVNLAFYKDKVVLVTGHTGFKGSWLCKILINCGAKVIGYALNPPTEPSLFNLSNIEKDMISIIGDIRDYEKLKEVFDKYQPEIVIHLAAQPLVIEGYKNPRYTYEVNILGTLNVLECTRVTNSVKSLLNVTTDKVYKEKEIEKIESNYLFKEEDPLDGNDPYSNSKSSSELITHSYKKSFFDKDNNDNNVVSISTARTGNSLGGGDFAKNRIIPDCIRAITNKDNKDNNIVIIRNPDSIRPYQHVLEPLFVYLEIIEKQYNNKEYEGSYNIGPDNNDMITNSTLVNMFINKWGDKNIIVKNNSINKDSNNTYYESPYIRLDTTKLRTTFNWSPTWNINDTIDQIINWTKVYLKDKTLIPSEMDNEINLFLKTKLSQVS